VQSFSDRESDTNCHNVASGTIEYSAVDMHTREHFTCGLVLVYITLGLVCVLHNVNVKAGTYFSVLANIYMYRQLLASIYMYSVS
jgi:hypothetical protein